MPGCDYFAGWVAGVGGLVVGAPFEAIKTKQQHLGVGFRNAAFTIKRLEGSIGILHHLLIFCCLVLIASPTTAPASASINEMQVYAGFFRGLSIPIAVSGPSNAIYYGLYGNVLSYMRGRKVRDFENPGDPVRVNDPAFMSKAVTHNIGKLSEQPYHPASSNDVIDHLVAGTVAGSVQVLLMCPVEVIRTRQLAYGSMVRNSVDCLFYVYRSKGLSGLYRGFYPNAARNLSGGIVQGLVYKTTMEWNSSNEELTWFQIWLGGGFAGMVSWWVVAPLDVIKTKMQADEIVSPKYSGTWNCAKKIVAIDGTLGLFRGLMSLSLPQFLVNGATFLVFNWATTTCSSVFPKV